MLEKKGANWAPPKPLLPWSLLGVWLCEPCSQDKLLDFSVSVLPLCTRKRVRVYLEKATVL